MTIPNHAPIYRDPRYQDLLESVDENGCVDVPTGPGLGAELDWEWLERNKTGTTVHER